MFTVLISRKYYSCCALARLSSCMAPHLWFSASLSARSQPQTNRPGTYSPHNASFPSKQWQQTGTSNTVLLSSLIHDDVTHRFFDSEREAFPRFWGQRYPGQSIMLCVLMIDSCRRGTRSSQRQQAWKGVNQLSGVVIWRTARLWLEFSIRTSTIHHATRERGGHTYFFISPSCYGQSEFWGIKKKGIWTSYAHKQVNFREWGVKDFLGLHSSCILSAHSRLRAAQPLRLWERNTALPFPPLRDALTDTWAKSNPGNLCVLPLEMWKRIKPSRNPSSAFANTLGETLQNKKAELFTGKGFS